MTRKVEEISLKEITQVENSRVTVNDKELEELMTSMRHNGLLQPIGVHKAKKGFEVVFGNRRLIAAKKLGWNTIPAVVVDLHDEFPEHDLIIKNAIENMQRTQPSVFEQGRLFQALIKDGLTAGQISARTGITLPHIKSIVEVYTSSLPAAFKKKIVLINPGASKQDGIVGLSAAKVLSNLSKSAKLSTSQENDIADFMLKNDYNNTQVTMLAHLVKKGISVRKAIKRAATSKRFTITFVMDTDEVERLEKRYKLTVSSLIYNFVESRFKLITKRQKNFKKSRKQRIEEKWKHY